MNDETIDLDNFDPTTFNVLEHIGARSLIDQLRWALRERYKTLVGQLAADEHEAGMLICKYTGLQPSEFDRLPLEHRLRYLRRALDSHTALPADCYVTLLQAASIVSRKKRALEEYKDRMPIPDVEGGGGRPAEWKWTTIRPWLEKAFKRKLPEQFPGDRFLRE